MPKTSDNPECDNPECECVECKCTFCCCEVKPIGDKLPPKDPDHGSGG